jgi:hopanoid-associated phosphorylase
MILAVTGLLREADIAASAEVKTIAGGGKASLAARLEEALAEDADGIISIGIAGGLAPPLKPGDCVVASEVVSGGERYATDAEWTARIVAALPAAILAPLAGMDAVIADAPGKAKLHRTTGAYAVDMESHIVARAARAHGIPFAALRTIADGANSQLPLLVTSALNEDGSVNVGAVLSGLIARPQDTLSLIRTARQSEKAFAALLRCRHALGSRLLGPDLGKLPLDMG